MQGMSVLKLRLKLAEERDRPAIYRLRHTIYAGELRQYPENSLGQLSDALDAYNSYIAAFESDGRLIGFISITPPGHSYSVEKYMDRADLPFPVDEMLYEVRLLAVEKAHRAGLVPPLLLYASLRWIEIQGGRRMMALGRSELIPMYRKLGFELAGRQVFSGAITLELMSLSLDRTSGALQRFGRIVDRLEASVDWQLPSTFRA
jgi:hypothetical protein